VADIGRESAVNVATIGDLDDGDNQIVVDVLRCNHPYGDAANAEGKLLHLEEK
jgi:hypothetical protein